MTDDTIQTLIRQAMAQLKYAYAPYSHFLVGAALLADSGTIYTGCNVENASYGASNCAERTAFFKAVSQGERSFQAICIVGGRDGNLQEFTPPCGICRQVMMEFCHPERFPIILARSEEDYAIYSLSQLLPLGFGPGALQP